MNAAGGVGGRPLQLLGRDDEGTAERAIAAAEELVARPGVVALAQLHVDRVVAGFGEAMTLHEVSLVVRPGELVALLGPSGAGKTTLIHAIVGLLPIHPGRIRLGAMRLDGPRPHRIAALGVATLPEGRCLFDERSVGGNLEVGAYLPGARRRAPAARALVERLFPALTERRDAAVAVRRTLLDLGREAPP